MDVGRDGPTTEKWGDRGRVVPELIAVTTLLSVSLTFLVIVLSHFLGLEIQSIFFFLFCRPPSTVAIPISDPVIVLPGSLATPLAFPPRPTDAPQKPDRSNMP